MNEGHLAKGNLVAIFKRGNYFKFSFLLYFVCALDMHCLHYIIDHVTISTANSAIY